MLQGLGYASSVAQLAGFDPVGLIVKIKQMARTASQNRADCEDLARRVDMLADLLSRLRAGPSEPAAAPTMAGLDETLREALHLVESCQGHGRTRLFFTASRMADQFRNVDRKIDSYLQHFQAINNIAIDRLARRLDALMMHTTNGRSAPRDTTTMADPAAETEEFTLAEITVATNNFAVVLAAGDSGTVYKGKLHDGREVAVKRRLWGGGAEDAVAFDTELAILSPLRHGNIIRLVGWCAEDGERIVVTELMANGSLHDHLHRRSSSPVTSSWKGRVEMLLAAARGVEHLHRHAMPALVIHGGITSSHILLGAAAAADVALTGFAGSVWRAAGVESQPVLSAAAIAGEYNGYADPELLSTGRIKPASDVYSFGVVMLEVLTGKPPVMAVWDERRQSTTGPMTLVSFALPSVQAGRLVDVLDRRPVAAPAAWQLQPLEMVATMAARCLRLHGQNRPGISEVVINLQRALELICTRGHF